MKIIYLLIIHTLFVLQLYIISEYSINLIKEYSIDLIEQVTSVKQVTDDSQFQDPFENKWKIEYICMYINQIFTINELISLQINKYFPKLWNDNVNQI